MTTISEPAIRTNGPDRAVVVDTEQQLVDAPAVLSRVRLPADHLAAHPEIGELGIDPLRPAPDGLIALDAVITGPDARSANPEDEQR
ncbi:hypothetical protein [Nocardia rhamnosiphila]